MTGGGPPHALLRPAIALPFLLVGLIWGSTWWVIADQLKGPPPAWSVVWRFAAATPAMFLVAVLSGQGWRISGAGHRLALVIGLTQFCGNYNFVYRAEEHLTSGIVAVMVGLIIVPNAFLGRVLLGQRITPRFIVGSIIAIAGIALLLIHEAQAAPPGRDVWLGVVLTAAGVGAASFAAVVQANETGRAQPMLALVGWSMAYGLAANVAYAWATTGPPVLPVRPTYWWGVGYLAIMGSVVTFPLYFRLIRDLGAGRAAYNGILVLMVAMTISTLFESYRWSVLAISGAALATAGLIIALRARNPVT